MKTSIVTFQLGKRKLTEGFINALETTFKNHELVRITALKSGCRDREELKKISQEICTKLGEKMKKDFTAKIVGFTIFVRKWRKLK